MSASTETRLAGATYERPPIELHNVHLGVIRDAAFAASLGVSRDTIRGLEAKGMPIMWIGKRRFVDVQKALEWLRQNSASQSAHRLAGGSDAAATIERPRQTEAGEKARDALGKFAARRTAAR